MRAQAAAGENTYSACDFGSGHPQICITAGIHGDEVSGIYTAQRLITYLKTHPRSGAVCVSSPLSTRRPMPRKAGGTLLTMRT